jgi:hypothetical protein
MLLIATGDRGEHPSKPRRATRTVDLLRFRRDTSGTMWALVTRIKESRRDNEISVRS